MDLLQIIYEAGIVGAGGAGFPTHVKLDCKVEYFIINAAECEPLLQVDKLLMRVNGEEIIQTIEEIGEAIEAQHLIIAIKNKNTNEIRSLSKAIKSMDSKVKLFYLDNYYPAGDEQVMVYEVTNRSIPEGGIPLDVDAVVSNVGTIVNIYNAIQGKPLTKKYLSIIGEVNSPIILRVPIGTSIEECIKASGGSTLKEYSIIIGGPMMGSIIDDNEARDYYIKKTDSSLIILPKDHYIVQRKRKPLSTIINEGKSACIQCRYCTDLCPRFLIGHSLRPHKVMRNIAMGNKDKGIMKEALICCECGICEMFSCPMGLSPRLVNIYVKKELREKGMSTIKKGVEALNREMFEYRKIPTPRLMARLGITKYYGQHFSEIKEITPPRVSISLNQHIGRPATSIVEKGEQVKSEQLIGRVHKGDLGACIHASIDGTVINVSEEIVIER